MTSSSSFMLFVAAVLLTVAMAQNSPQDYVDAHNKARADVGVGPVTWDDTVAEYAQAYANKQRGGFCRYKHSDSGGKYGENINFDHRMTGEGAVERRVWVAKKRYYNHTSNSCMGVACDDYMTQVVWRNTTAIGCARVPCIARAGYALGLDYFFVTCNYSPPGNIAGQSP